MKKLFLLISLFTTSLHVAAECSYSGTGGGINVSFTNVKILSDSSQPNGAILAAATRGGNVTDVKTFSNCDPSDVYVIHSTSTYECSMKPGSLSFILFNSDCFSGFSACYKIW